MSNFIGFVDGMACPWHCRGSCYRRENGWEAFAPGVFDVELRSRANVVALVGHVWSAKLCDTDSGLILSARADGLYCRIPIPDTVPGREVVRGIRLPDRDPDKLRGLSVGYNVAKWEWRGSYGNGSLHKLITSARLNEISIVRQAAYLATHTAGLDLTLFPATQRQAAPVVEWREEPRPGREETTTTEGRDELERLDRALMLSAYQLARG